MSLNNISLPPFVAASLYRSSLVANDTSEPFVKVPSAETKEEKTWKYLGDNKKNILLVVDHQGITHLPDDELAFITAMLTACKLDMGDVAIVNRSNYPGHVYKDFAGYFSSRVVLLFGTDPVSFGLPVDFPQFQVQTFNNTTFLYSPALKVLGHDKLLKSKLWVCLQKIFLK